MKLHNYTEFKEIKKEYKNNHIKNLKESINYIKNLKNDSHYLFNKLTKKQKEKTFTQQKKIIIEKLKKECEKEIEKRFDHLDQIAKAKKADYIKISVEWVKNKTWGMNPRAEVWAHGYTTGNASGCGYDKLSSAISYAFNKNDSILNLVLNEIEFYYRHKNYNIREAIGYGVDVWGFSYGVGYSSFKNIFDKLGAKVNTWNETKTSDFMCIEF